MRLLSARNLALFAFLIILAVQFLLLQLVLLKKDTSSIFDIEVSSTRSPSLQANVEVVVDTYTPKSEEWGDAFINETTTTSEGLQTAVLPVIKSTNNTSVTSSAAWVDSKDYVRSIRIAAVVVCYGPLPVWFDAFILTAKHSAELFDWLIFVMEDVDSATFGNVRLFNFKIQGLLQLLRRLNVGIISDLFSDDTWVSMLDIFIRLHSFSFDELKPLYGSLFHDYLLGYSHWAFADINILSGRMSTLVTRDILRTFDVYSISHGDSNRIHLHDQMTIFKNNDRINTVWQKCDHLQRFGEKILAFNENITRYSDEREKLKWPFESIEGCFSKAILDDKELYVYISLGQFSFGLSSFGEGEALLVESKLLRCQGFKLPSKMDLMEIDDYNKSTILSIIEAASPLRQIDKGLKFFDVISKRGELLIVPSLSFRQSNCQEGVFMHTHGYESSYFSYTTRSWGSDTHILLISTFGFIPLRYPQLGISSLDIGINEWGSSSIFQFLVSKEAENKNIKTHYCSKFSQDLRRCLKALHSSQIRMIRRPDKQTLFIENEIETEIQMTILISCFKEDFVSGAMTKLLSSWIFGPKVLIIGTTSRHMSNDLPNLDTFGPDLTIVEVDIFDKISQALPYNMLINIGLDLVNTDLLCICPLCRDSSIIFGARSVLPEMISPRLNYIRFLEQIEDKGQNLPAIVIPFFEDVEHHLTSMSSSYKSLYSVCEINNVNGTKNELSFSLREFWRQSSKSGGEKMFKYRNKEGMIRQKKVTMKKSSQTSSPTIKNRKEMLFERGVIALPVIFNRTRSPHGIHFLRFPEELDRIGCFGGVHLDAFVGAGYTLYWPEVYEDDNLEIFSAIASSIKQGDSLKSTCSCGLLLNDEKPLEQFLESTWGYNRRANKLVAITRK